MKELMKSINMEGAFMRMRVEGLEYEEMLAEGGVVGYETGRRRGEMRVDEKNYSPPAMGKA